MNYAKQIVLSITASLITFSTFSCLSAEECDSVGCDAMSRDHCGNLGCLGDWSGSVDAIFWNRTQNYTGGLVLDESNPPAFALTGSDIDFDVEAGLRATLSKRLTDCQSIEFVYFGINEWSDSAIALGANNRSLPGDAGLATFDYFNADAIEASYQADTHNLEINLQIERDSFNFLLGFRYLKLDESFRLAAFDADTFTSDYRVSTDNDLYGGQIGLNLNHCYGCFDLSAVVKSGVYANDSSQYTLFRDLSNTLTLRDIRRSDTDVASISEIRLNADVRLTDRISARFGYNFLWATDLALAPYQLDFTNTATSSDFLDNQHSVFMHGANVGLTFNF